MTCHHCAFAGLDWCVCRDTPGMLDAPAPWPDNDPDAELYIPPARREEAA